MSKFFINRPIVAMVISILLVIVGAVTIVSSADRPIPGHRPAGNPGSGHLRRRGCANARAIGCHSHRAADEWRGQHELHVFLKCHRQLITTLIVNFDVKTDPNTDLILTQSRERKPRLSCRRRLRTMGSPSENQ